MIDTAGQALAMLEAFHGRHARPQLLPRPAGAVPRRLAAWEEERRELLEAVAARLDHLRPPERHSPEWCACVGLLRHLAVTRQ
ncbi:MAG: hypothetical protein FJW37_00510 [Acidobacteria bacterium]|nr:hypothetical protein [Acidobacteriota bacterium]